MSDKKLDLIISKLDKIDNRLDRHEEMVSTLIKMVGSVGARTEEISADLKDTSDTLHMFRSEADVNFKKLDAA